MQENATRHPANPPLVFTTNFRTSIVAGDKGQANLSLFSFTYTTAKHNIFHHVVPHEKVNTQFSDSSPSCS
jgi:hypothetical protein